MKKCIFCENNSRADAQQYIELAKGDNKNLGLVIDFLNGGLKQIVAYAHSSCNCENASAYYVPKYCPECGRELRNKNSR